MSKLRLLISVGICGVIFSGCGFFESMFSSKIEYKKSYDDCVPNDLSDRLANKDYYEPLNSYKSPEALFLKYSNERYNKIFQDSRYDGTGTTKCYDLLIESYNEAIKKYNDYSVKVSTNIKEEMAFENEYIVCNKMPSWLEKKLNEYISQNRSDDIAYINASKFKGAWNGKLDGEQKFIYRNNFAGTFENTNMLMARCFAYKVAIKAIENDLIDLGNGKKAKCVDLSYDDAPKCLDYFISVYDEAHKSKRSELDAEQKEIDIKKERKKYEKRNSQ